MWHWMGNGFGWGIGMIGMALFWLVLAALLVWIVRAASDRRTAREGPGAPETPLDILQRRYARGEIGRAEYEEKRKDLT